MFKDKETGAYKVQIWTEHGPRVISTKQTNLSDARSVIEQSGVKTMELAARAGKLSAVAATKVLFGKGITLGMAVKHWTEWLESTGRSQRTAHHYQTILAPWLASMGDRSPDSIHESDIASWINQPSSSNKLSTRSSKLAAARSLFDYCAAKGWSFGNPAKLVRVNLRLMDHAHKERFHRDGFSDMEIDRLLAATEDPFWKAAIRIGRMTGLRLGDICQLERDSVAKAGVVVCWTDKRDRRVEVPVDAGAMADILDSIQDEDPAYLFPAVRSIAIDPTRRAAISVQFQRICKRAGIQGKSFHCLRYSYAEAQAKQGADVWYIAKRLGHCSTRMTEHYLGIQ